MANVNETPRGTANENARRAKGGCGALDRSQEYADQRRKTLKSFPYEAGGYHKHTQRAHQRIRRNQPGPSCSIRQLAFSCLDDRRI